MIVALPPFIVGRILAPVGNEEQLVTSVMPPDATSIQWVMTAYPPSSRRAGVTWNLYSSTIQQGRLNLCFWERLVRDRVRLLFTSKQ